MKSKSNSRIKIKGSQRTTIRIAMLTPAISEVVECLGKQIPDKFSYNSKLYSKKAKLTSNFE